MRMSSSLKLVTLALMSVDVSCVPGPDPVLWNSPLPTPFDDELKEELEEIKDENKELQTKLSALMTKLDGLSYNFTKLGNTDNFDENVFGDIITAFNDSLTSLTIKTASNSKNVEKVTQDVVNLKASDQKQENRINSLTSSDQQQENRIVDNIKKLKSVSRYGKWCGYQNGWSTANSIINYDSLKFSSSNMDIISTPLNIKTGIFTVPVSGAWRVTISLWSLVGSGQENLGYLYFNNNQLPESQHSLYSSSGQVNSAVGQEVTLEATAGDTISYKTTKMANTFYRIHFCVAFEHGSNPQSRFSPRDEEISHSENQDHFHAEDEDISRPEYQENFSVDVEDIPGPKYQDSFPEDDEYFSADLEKSPCSSNADCPPQLACIRSVLSSDPGTCGDPWCWREEWNCGSGSRCIIANHKPLCV